MTELLLSIPTQSKRRSNHSANIGTIADETDAHHAKFIVGHKTGMSDKYVLRQATNKKVVACCEAIEEHFFGGTIAGPTVK